MIERKMEILYIAWYTIFRLFEEARSAARYTKVQTGPPDVAIRVEIITLSSN